MCILSLPRSKSPVVSWTVQKFRQIFGHTAPRAWHVRDALRASPEPLTAAAIVAWLKRHRRPSLSVREVASAVNLLRANFAIEIGHRGVKTYRLLPDYLNIRAAA
jgi:hypothetical protein